MSSIILFFFNIVLDTSYNIFEILYKFIYFMFLLIIFYEYIVVLKN